MFVSGSLQLAGEEHKLKFSQVSRYGPSHFKPWLQSVKNSPCCSKALLHASWLPSLGVKTVARAHQEEDVNDVLDSVALLTA